MLQTSQKLEITTPANENQADFTRKHTKINPGVYPRKHSLGILPGAFWSLPPEALTWYPAGGLVSLVCSLLSLVSSFESLTFFKNCLEI